MAYTYFLKKQINKGNTTPQLYPTKLHCVVQEGCARVLPRLKIDNPQILSSVHLYWYSDATPTLLSSGALGIDSYQKDLCGVHQGEGHRPCLQLGVPVRELQRIVQISK